MLLLLRLGKPRDFWHLVSNFAGYRGKYFENSHSGDDSDPYIIMYTETYLQFKRIMVSRMREIRVIKIQHNLQQHKSMKVHF